MSKKWSVSFNKESYKNIYGSELGEDPAGFCTNATHIGYLTIGNIKKHECLSKQCPFLIKNEKNPFWSKRDKKQLIRKYMQKIEKDYVDNKISRERYNKLKTIKNQNYMRDYLLTNDTKTIEEVKKGKMTMYIVKEENVIERITIEEMSKMFCNGNKTEAMRIWSLLAKTINDYKIKKIGKNEVTEMKKYKEGIYRTITLQGKFVLFGKGMNEEYAKIVISKNYI